MENFGQWLRGLPKNSDRIALNILTCTILLGDVQLNIETACTFVSMERLGILVLVDNGVKV